ncbi:MAG TPA: helix-turn-helix domain-containing protein [Candidatus Dormibacteraeota bacterium]|nr:helix-turn-helix domain-containing protein [Candidatus Dormibacteraeota bacterium]
MTEEARARARRFIHRGQPQPAPPEHALPDRLVQARERKGVDLYRAERDTKIRARYLAALERGDYRELPGVVYTRGFLRNYATYLGLDADEVLRQWHDERGDSAPLPKLTVPKPLLEPRRGLTFSPGVVVAALLTVAVLAFVGYIAIQLLRFAKPPMVAVTSPATAVIEVDDTTTQYTIAGTATAGATIEITTPGRDQPYRVSASPDGTWSVSVDLRRGKNEFQITARDPETGKNADQPVARVISVPFLVIEAPSLTVDSPADGATFQNGAIPVSGQSRNATTITVEAHYLGAPGSAPASPAPSAAASAAPGASARPAPSPSPKPVPSPSPAARPSPAPSGPPAPSPSPSGPSVAPQTVQPADDGSFSAPLELSAGRWSIVVTAASADGKSVSITRTVTVQFSGVNLVVTVKGGRAWLKVWVDGKIDPGIGAAGQVIGDGRSLTFTGQSSVEVRTGNSGATTFTLNGADLGALGPPGIPETWLFAPPAAPQKTTHT